MKTKIINSFLVLCILFTLTGCAQSTWLYRVTIQQGNIFTPEMVEQLHVGMTKEAVCDLLGPPLLMDTFNDNRWTYIFTYKANKSNFIERSIILYFNHDHVCSIKIKK